MTANTAATVTAYLCASPAADAIDFYKRAFGAEEKYRLVGDDGRIGHAEIVVGETVLMLADEWPEYRVLSPKTLDGCSVSFVMIVPDADAAFERATSAGAIVERALKDDGPGRSGWLVDPFGHRWNILTPNPDFDPAAQ
jgi:PhnB protein